MPRAVAATAEQRSVVLDWVTPRAKLVELIEATYPGVRREHVHVWTLRGKSRVSRLSRAVGYTWVIDTTPARTVESATTCVVRTP